MTTLASRSSLIAALSILPALLLACGGGGGGGGGNKGGPGGAACDTLCSQVISCAAELSSDVATLTGDETMTNSNCASHCTAMTCTDTSSFVSCSSGLTCSSTFPTALQSCGEAAGCHGGGGGGGGGGASCSTICADLVACATTLGTSVATLSGDPAMTNANCATECGGLSCTDKEAFVSCADGMTCNSIGGVQAQMGSCYSNGSCG